jgi:hypothetical protein
LAHGFNVDKIENYEVGYLINLLNFVFFCLGYIFIPYKNNSIFHFRKSNKPATFILLFYVIFFVINFLNRSGEYGYSDLFSGLSETNDLPYMEIFLRNIFNKLLELILLITINPLTLYYFDIIINFINYVSTGIKGSLAAPFFCLILIIQFKGLKISGHKLTIFLFLLICMIFLLIGSMGFRGSLSMQSLMETVLNFDSLIDSWSYFLVSPELSHIIYTTDIYNMINLNITSYRYGFDYIRLIIYPVKNLFYQFDLASYNQYVALRAGPNAVGGLYLGLAGELFWNFGWFFPLISFFYGFVLKCFTNFAFSGNYFNLILYLISFKEIVWFLYRGQANTFIFFGITLFVAFILVNLLVKIKYLRKLFGIIPLSNK